MSPLTRLRINQPYTGEQLRKLISQEDAEALKLQGYFLEYNPLDQTFRVKHYTQGSAPMRGDGKIVTGTATFDELPPIRKRTPHERVDSLMLKFIGDMRQAGTIPGVDDEKVREIVGEAWKTGRTEITGEVVRQVAQYFLNQAEQQAK